MQLITVCPNCGHTLANSNKTGKCYRPCKAKEVLKVVEVRAPIRPSEVRVDLTKYGVNYEKVFNAVCEHFDLNGAQIKRMVDNKQDRKYRHIRYLLLHLCVIDLGLSQEEAGGYLERDRKTASIAMLDVASNPDKYSWDMQAIRKKYYPQTEVVPA